MPDSHGETPPTMDNNGQEQLAEALAFSLAAALQAVPGCPRRKEVIEAIADWLIAHCSGVDSFGEHWDPERQARWLIDQAIEWDTWRGVAGLRQLLEERFAPVPEEYPGLGPKPPVHCARCQDWGVIPSPGGLCEWCTCPAAEALRANIPDLVADRNQRQENYNRRQRQQPEPTRLAPALAPMRPITQADIDQALAFLHAAQAAQLKPQQPEQSPAPKGQAGRGKGQRTKGESKCRIAQQAQSKQGRKFTV